MPADKNKFLRTTEKDSHYRHLEKNESDGTAAQHQ